MGSEVHMGTMEQGVDFSVLVRSVAPARVFDLLATPDGVNEWFTRSTTIDPRPGGSIVFRWQDWGPTHFAGEIPGAVVEWSRGTRFVFTWRADSGGYDTSVVVTFEPREGGTLVHLTEKGYEDSPVGLQDLLNRAQGWGSVLTLLKFYAEHGIIY